jgi:chromosome partitioning protein
MKIVTIATQKGGAGKTTLATNLAVASSVAGFLTLIIDADFQQTALDWFNKRDNQENPLVISATSQTILENLLKLAEKKGIERVFIDTQGADANLVNFAIRAADFCLLPCSSGGFDIGAQRTTAATVLRLNKPAAFVITKSSTRGQEAQETKTILQGLGIQIADCRTTLLKIYKDAALFNSSVIELEPKGKAATEIKQLFEWLEKKLNKNQLLTELQGMNHE